MRGVISIGANLGQEYEGWLSLGVKHFIFFEPVKKTFAKLSKILSGKPGVILKNVALGNTKGSVFMFTETEHQGKSCSILQPTGHLEQYPDIEFTGKEKVDIDKLDNIEYDRTLYDHLHIDTQGYELEVLKGAVYSLSYISTIECEVYRKELYKGCPDWKEVWKFLEEMGFEMKNVYWRGLTWGDATFERVCEQ